MALTCSIVGSGAFAADLRRDLPALGVTPVPWPPPAGCDGILHVGSGRQLAAVLARGEEHGTLVIQASTGQAPAPDKPGFPYVEAPNLAIPIVRFLAALRQVAPLFRDLEFSIAESHQQAKTTVPGTAKAMAEALSRDSEGIRSVRDPAEQLTWGVPEEHLAGHAVHRLQLQGLGVTLNWETRVMGREAYAHGVRALLAARGRLTPGAYHVADLVKDGLL